MIPGHRLSRTRTRVMPLNQRGLNMRKIWQVIAVAVVGLGLGLAVVGCGSPMSTGKDKMGGDKMGGGKMSGDKMGGGKMSGEKNMEGDKGRK